jgi:hypothetical protein
MTAPFCAAAHIDDPRPCDGPADAVVVRDKFGGEASGCVRHAAAMLAAVDGSTVHAGSVPGAAIEAFKRAQRGAA